MKFDKETIAIIVVCVGMLLGWPMLTNYFYPSAQPKPAAQASQVQTPVQQPSTAPAAQIPPAAQAASPLATAQAPASIGSAPVVPAAKPAAHFSFPDLPLENGVVKFMIDPNRGCVQSVLLKKFKTADKKELIALGSYDSPQKAFGVLGLDDWTLVDVKLDPADAKSGSDMPKIARVFRKGKEALAIVESFALGDSYVLKCSWDLRNVGEVPLKLPLIGVSAGGLPPLKELSGDTVFTDPHHLDYCLSANKSVASFSPDAKEEKFRLAQTLNSLDWVGCSNKYFAKVLIPVGSAFNGGNMIARVERDMNGVKYFDPSIAGAFKDIDLAPGASKNFEFEYYAGPKEMKLVGALLPPTCSEILHISYWSWFEFIARPLLMLLNWLKGWCGSYGVAIILLTVIVRIVFWPATHAANKSMRKMQKIQPKVQALREKYKGDSQAMNVKIMELYKTEKVNPLGGCLPLLLQLPVFIALYSALDASVELRQVSFLWATDLSKPDLVGPPLLFGIGLHPFVIMMTVLMFIQQKMTPSMGDPMQQKMMLMMPVIMLVLLYNLPSGLTLYWTVSNAFSIIQLKYNLYLNKREEEMESLKSKPA